MNLVNKLKEIQKENTILWAANFYNLETLKGILQAAAAMGEDIILQLTSGSIEYMGLQPAAAMARAMSKEMGVQAWLHLDHGDSGELVKRCLDAGFDSVMIDASEQPMEENIQITREVVKLASVYNVNVEAELGYVAKLGQSTAKTGFTEPEDAKRFVDETGVNTLAVAIGSVHGFYKDTPKLDFSRLQAIRKAVDIPLVLHGGSGIPMEQLRRAVENGICKINVATETKNTFMKAIAAQTSQSDEIDLRKVFPPAITAVQDLLAGKIRNFRDEERQNLNKVSSLMNAGTLTIAII